MSKEEEFFSPKHNQLLTLAVWAKYLAWAALIYFIVWAAANLSANYYGILSNYRNMSEPVYSFTDLVRLHPGQVSKIIFEAVSILVKGAIYFVVLKGISLGLNMIVETDINYRGKLNGEATNER